MIALMLLLACDGKAPVTDSAPVDSDGDGFLLAEDCDDGSATVFPGAEERCDAVDQDCDGLVDEGVSELWYADADADGYGDPATEREECLPPEGFVSNALDCADGDREIRPGAEERCDGVDNDCDEGVDEGLLLTVYVDADGDGYGDSSTASQACEAASGQSEQGGDCDDGDAAVGPGEAETCDGVDNDCDTLVDESGGEWYADTDFDGYGDPGAPLFDCDQPDGAVANGEDCDDSSAAIRPGALDHCDGQDNDCDALVDEAAKAGWWLMSVDTEASTIFRVDTSNASLSTVSSINYSNINTMDVNEDGTAIVQSGATRELLELDACTGTLSLIGSTGVGNMCGIAFGPGGQLFGLDSTNDQLVSIDLNTGAGTVVGPLGFDLGNCGLSYDCSNDVLYGADGRTDQVFVVDPSSGGASSFVTTQVPFQSVGLEFDIPTGLLYASTRYELYTVEPSTGNTALVGTLGGTNIDDLGYHPVCN